MIQIDYDQIHNSESTLSTNNSEKLFKEVCQQDWRCYSSVLVPQTEALVERFLASHARMPGIITEEMLALVPIDIFRYTNKDNGLRIEGATFTNGAVVTMACDPPIKLLFIDGITADRWRYPEGYVSLKVDYADNPPAISA